MEIKILHCLPLSSRGTQLSLSLSNYSHSVLSPTQGLSWGYFLCLQPFCHPSSSIYLLLVSGVSGETSFPVVHIANGNAPFKHSLCISLISNLTFVPWHCVLQEGKHILFILIKLTLSLHAYQMVE